MKHNFTLVVLAIVGVSVLPILYEIWSSSREGKGGGAAHAA